MKVDEVLDKYGYRVQNLMGRSQAEERNQARQQLKELVLGCVPKDLGGNHLPDILTQRCWKCGQEKATFDKPCKLNDRAKGFNSCNAEARTAIEELFKEGINERDGDK
jgi:hypothetical protein